MFVYDAGVLGAKASKKVQMAANELGLARGVGPVVSTPLNRWAARMVVARGESLSDHRRPARQRFTGLFPVLKSTDCGRFPAPN